MRNRLFFGFGLIALASVVLFLGVQLKNEGSSIFSYDTQDLESFTKVLDISDVRGLVSSGQCDITVIPSDSNYVIITHNSTSKNNSRVEDGTLFLEFNTSSYEFFGNVIKDDIKVTIYSSQLCDVVLKGVSNITCDSILEVDSFKIANKGVGDVNLKINGTWIHVTNKGAGDIDLATNTKVAIVENKGIGNITSHMNTDTLLINNAGAGSVKLEGSAKYSNFRNAGIGDLSAGKMQIANLELINKGIGSADVYVTDSLSISNSGIGDISYTGEAVVYKLSEQGVGSVSKKN